MWISRKAFEEIQSAIHNAREEVTRTYDLTAALRAHADERIRDKESIIQSQESRLAVLELERRELTSLLWTRETERSRPPASIDSAPLSDWESIMQAQINELAEDIKTT